MSIEEFAEKLKRDLYESGDVTSIIERILSARHDDKTPLSIAEKEKILTKLRIKIDRKTGMQILTESDNSSYLSMVNEIEKAIMGGNK